VADQLFFAPAREDSAPGIYHIFPKNHAFSCDLPVAFKYYIVYNPSM
jgi:hypothetical protein